MNPVSIRAINKNVSSHSVGIMVKLKTRQMPLEEITEYLQLQRSSEPVLTNVAVTAVCSCVTNTVAESNR